MRLLPYRVRNGVREGLRRLQARGVRTRRLRQMTPPKQRGGTEGIGEEVDAFDGSCYVCGRSGRFSKGPGSFRETYQCAHCTASLRYQGQALAILHEFADSTDIRSLAQLTRDPAFQSKSIYEPGTIGPLRRYLSSAQRYEISQYLPNAKPGTTRNGIRCENLMSLTFLDSSFDLVVTSDVFEHVRKPWQGFREVLRVLRPGGVHIFSVPVHHPIPDDTVYRVDTSSAHDVHLLEPHYHNRHLVYTDFGLDMVNELITIGYESTVITQFTIPTTLAFKVLTFTSRKPR